MSNLTRLRSPGSWTLGSTVLPGEFEEFDSRWPKLINAADGSVHAPTLPIIIGGAGFQVTGGFEASDVEALTVANGGAVNFANGSELNFAATVQVSVDAGSWSFTNGSAFVLDSGSTIEAGALQIDTTGISMPGGAWATATGNLTMTAAIILSVGATLEAGGLQIDTTGISMPGGSWATATGNLTMTKKFVLSGADAGVVERIGTVADANSTIDVSKDHYFVPKSLSFIRRYTLRHSTSPVPVDGQEITVSRNHAVTSDAEFQREDTTLLATLEIGGQAVKSSITFVYYAAHGGWVVKSSTGTASVENLGSTYH